MAQTSEGATESVEAVRFSFMTDDEVRKHSVLKITNPNLVDSLHRPMPGGLYDPRLGTTEERVNCISCGEWPFHCPGHCGHIDLVSPVYNPLLFNMLYNLLEQTCFSCLHFRAPARQVDWCILRLEMIAKGDVIKAKNLSVESSNEYIYSEDSDGSHFSGSTVLSCSQGNFSEREKQVWTSLQLKEATSVLNDFLKTRSAKCKNCNFRNPKISKPMFGWFEMQMSDSKTRGNVIRSAKVGDMLDDVEERASSEVIDGNEPPSEDGSRTAERNSASASSTGKRHKRKAPTLPSEYHQQKRFFSGPLLPSEVRDVIKNLWENEAGLCSYISDIQQEQLNSTAKGPGSSIFFLEAILVPPTRFRPMNKAGDDVLDHPQTVLLNKVLECNTALGNAHTNNSERSRIFNRWMDLQQSINVLFDNKTATGQGQRNANPGICQLLEKKEGIFRQKMMGKRVNYACRSVISPDPYLDVNEIGIPPYFALRLTYPERVTPWNAAILRNAIINGPEVHPGATFYADKEARVRLQPSKKARIPIARKLPSSRGIVAQSKKSSGYEFEGKTVERHMRDGDIVLVNRQPTLHKPSMMAHRVRVLKGEKTIRMHYANCSSYNADFDGDEMNVHLPRDEIARAEAYNIVDANNQYIVPTKGDTVRGLIQDHIVSAVLLTMKNTFLNRDEFDQLLYVSGVFTSGRSSNSGSKKVTVVGNEGLVQSVLPAVWKPKPLWTGKQVITAVLNHLTRGYTPCIVNNKVKIPDQYFSSVGHKGLQKNFGEEKSEKKSDQLNEEKADKNRKRKKDKKVKSENHKEFQSAEDKQIRANSPQTEADETKFLIWKNELVSGVIDKAQFGKYGLVHTVQELYGPNTAGLLLSALSRLFTSFLQFRGFTCGVEDLIVSHDCDTQMKVELEGDDAGEKVHLKFLNLELDKPEKEKQPKGKVELQLEIEKAIHRNGQSAVASLDNLMQAELREKGSMISKKWLPNGLLKPFPFNCIALMTISGAKGSTVNFQQISFLLGQQELEGKRVPRMVSGKTLPSFPPWDWTSRAGGYITDRFLTGLRPQEYYFHCMAGREGLVDTAVKTSRSGYLQRCLIKNLECLKVCYDHTVRDADGSIVQFLYGEDGVDVHQTSFLNNVEVLKTNRDIICEKFHQQLEFNDYVQELPQGVRDKAKNIVEKSNKEKQVLLEQEKHEDLLMILRQKYLSSLAQSGEPVGVIAAQSVGEPSTQMTLNTFHLAGRGEMNVTLGIPRLQEILMTATAEIKTPIVTCPLIGGRSKEDAQVLVEKLQKLTVAEMLESIEVSVQPLPLDDNVCRIYKLMIKLKKPKHVSVQDCQETLEFIYLRALEDAIESHINLLSRISGIYDLVASNSLNETDEGSSSVNKPPGEESDDDGGDGERVDDLGSDFHKRKQQESDEVDYEDGIEEEVNDEEPLAELVKETDDSVEISDAETVAIDGDRRETEGLGSLNELSPKLMPKSQEEKTQSKLKVKRKLKAEFVRKKYDRAISVKVKDLKLEVEFKFTNEPEILLAQVAQRTAKKVYIKGSGKLDQCQTVQYSVNVKQVCWNEENPQIMKLKVKKKDPKANTNEDSLPWALTAAGNEIDAFWEMEDELDLRHVYSNNIHAMLNTYGVEAARRTILLEIKNVFGSYGVDIDYRHLSLIADFMTHAGGYSPLSRHGSIADSVSPFLKMSFETATKCIVEAASRGITDRLESPSARICLGLPAKVGTGSFDLMQKFDV